MKEKFPRDILNKIKWVDNNLKEANIYYVSRGAKKDTACCKGKDIIEIGKSFIMFQHEGCVFSIPQHRILTIEYKGEVIFNRTKSNEEDEK